MVKPLKDGEVSRGFEIFTEAARQRTNLFLWNPANADRPPHLLAFLGSDGRIVWRNAEKHPTEDCPRNLRETLCSDLWFDGVHYRLEVALECGVEETVWNGPLGVQVGIDPVFGEVWKRTLA